MDDSKNINLLPGANICISKNIFYTNLYLYLEVSIKKWFLYNSICVITITNTMTNIKRYFVFIFSGIGFKDKPIIDNCSEFTSFTKELHLILSIHILG